MFLSEQRFSDVVAATPLVSIDLIVSTGEQILLGKRKNKPAQHYWFVPGGRILKNETLDAAFSRLTENELGINLHRTEAFLLGTYEHFYNDSMYSADLTTHYIVLAYEIRVKKSALNLPIDQHDKFQWFTQRQLLEEPLVHIHTKDYFIQ